MTSNNTLKSLEASDIKSKIYTVRGVQVMLDRDLAWLYQVETKNLNKAVNRNSARFPISFRFQLTKEEFEHLRFQIGTFEESLNTKYLPYVFTEQGVSMLSAVLRSEDIIKMLENNKTQVFLTNDIKKVTTSIVSTKQTIGTVASNEIVFL